MYYVYILASQRNGTLYVGVTNNIDRRVEEHKSKIHPKSFSAQYNVNKLVYYETYKYILTAIKREKQLKKWRRKWKLKLIETDNPQWHDLSLNS